VIPEDRPPAPEPLRVPVADSHCHLDMGRDGSAPWPVPEALAAAAAVGVTRVVQVGCDVASSRWSVDASLAHPNIVAAVALHPNEVPSLAVAGTLDAALDDIDALAAMPTVRAVGETGLDHVRTGLAGRVDQEMSFRAHIEIAQRHGKALMIHDREAHSDVLRVLADAGPPERVVFHCFSGDAAMAAECAERGYVLSFAGTVTFANAQGLREALTVVPIDQLLVETDAPFLAPVPHRGRPNASYLVPLTLRAMAKVRGDDVEVLSRAIAATTERIFDHW
jgi:TatD DNase family protein